VPISQRRWGFLRATAFLLMAGAPGKPDDYVVARGTTHSVEELVACAFEHVGLDWTRYVRIDSVLARDKDERRDLVGDSSKAREVLGWHPTVTFAEIVHGLVDGELHRLAETGPGRS
jgi:GDPmannose 4,6-dehydratase